jgi:N-acetylmuramoyl-L-alanine amidase
MRKITHIVIHCTAGPQTQTVEAIQGYWRRVLGWKQPGYHHLIRADGTVADLQPIERRTNGVAGHNAGSIHIGYLGGVEVTSSRDAKGKVINVLGKAVDNRTPEQRATMERLVRKYHKLYPTAVILGHRDFSPDKNRDGIIQPSEWMKTCPSFSVRTWLGEIGLQPLATNFEERRAKFPVK